VATHQGSPAKLALSPYDGVLVIQENDKFQTGEVSTPSNRWRKWNGSHIETSQDIDKLHESGCHARLHKSQKLYGVEKN
jgi:hypothetical protein